MIVPMRRLALGLAALWLLSPVVCAAQDPLLVQKDYDSLTDSEQWMVNDVWCIAALDNARDVPGYDNAKLANVRQADVDEFIEGEGGSQDELDANVAYATAYYRDNLQNGTLTLGQILDGCGYDIKS